MSIDMQQFNAVFFEEVSEHLTNMEALLLDIEVASPNLEDLNAIFRAAHSIKGGAGIFGFDDMTEVTHILETLLDKLRKEELTLTTEMIDAFLKAGDILGEQKTVHQDGGEAVDSERIKAVCTLLDRLSSEETPTPCSASEVDSGALQAEKNISFLVLKDEDVSHLLEELAKFGQLTSQSEDAEQFTKWQVVLSDCAVSDDEIIDNISFVAEPESIIINGISQVQDDSFGFFDEEPVAEDDQKEADFGFFNESSENESPSSDVEEKVEESFGFFEESPTPETKPENVAPVEEEGFGLFEDEEPPTAKVAAAKSTIKSKASKKVSATKTVNKRATSKTANTTETSIRVNTEKVDQLINQVGELVITQAMLMQISNELDPSEHDVLLNRLTQLERNTRDLQESVMSIRMMPISFVFGRFPRVVRDLSSKLNKKIELRMVGDETELDKGLVEQLADPLTHLIRNSIDHGIEMPEERLANGKPEVGTITLLAFYEGGNVVINITDDGAGLNREKILEKALERGLDVNDSMSDSEVYQLIFSAGFSTADKVTDVSGRGVGMDVVKRNIHGMGGQVDIHSEAGIGSTISIRLPLTLAILDGMSISVAGQIFIIPLTFISESLQPQVDDIKSISGKGTVVKVRGDYIPLLALHELFNIDTDIKQANDGILVLLESNNKKIALLVDQLEGQQQVVLKSLETNFHTVPCISGATIMGDGTVALILDVAGLVSASD
ncbi:chemotaxis protein CheW [Psychromonas sp. Urea-02u-13]|uniref:chemotaxis protein CheW n=1 Tax=Psychromonas sp. Urea-02u-13 TaxID=2058326 RepID=UPI000C333F9D|nr:chemotaxis protein CheW [Psychromonas sp. Urea-02u-13]PKG38375.1 chemotaxis protein CheA [Psychromonas sp. Urea-02u-13]